MADDPSERGSNSTRDHYPTITRAQESWRQGNGEIEPKKDSQTGVYCHSGELRVVFNDEDMVVLDKPSGLRTVPGRPTTNGQELESRAERDWHGGTKQSRQDFWIDVVRKTCNSLLRDESLGQNEAFRGHLKRLMTDTNVPRKRTKFTNYAAVTLGLDGEEGKLMTSRIWNAVESGLKLEAGPGTDCLLNRVKVRWADARHVHRLDQDTSGLVVMAITSEAATEISRQFRERAENDDRKGRDSRQIKFNCRDGQWVLLDFSSGSKVPGLSKVYSAVLEGKMAKSPTQGEITAKLRPDLSNRPRQVLDEETGKAAVTRWQIVGEEADRTRVEFTPVTGRTHQLRLHAVALGHPIVGDSLYGTAEGRAKSSRLLLHARRLSFLHPRTGDKVEFESPPPF